MLSEDHDKTPRSISPVTHKRFAVLFFLASCCENSPLYLGKRDLTRFDLGFPYGRASEARPSFL